MSNALHFLISTIFHFLTMMFLLRFLMQAIKTSFHNPVGQMVIALTDFAVKPIRKFIPSWKKLDLSTLVLAFIVQCILQLLLLWLLPIQLLANAPIWSIILVKALLGVIRGIVDIFFYAIILQVILSWVNPNTPIAPFLNSFTRPILAPIQKVIPAFNGIDLSPLIAILLLQMFNILIVSW